MVLAVDCGLDCGLYVVGGLWVGLWVVRGWWLWVNIGGWLRSRLAARKNTKPVYHDASE